MPNPTSTSERPERALALDIGGTKIAAGVVDSEGRLVHRRLEFWGSVEADDRLEQTIRISEELLAATDARIIGIGVGVPAVVDHDGTIASAPNLACWDGLALRQLLRERLGMPCWIGHDGQLAALGEYWYGAGKGAQSLAAIIVGTGIGGGLVIDGEVYGGASGLAGAGLGWVVPDRAALEVAEYANTGSLEARVGGRGLAARAERLAIAEPEGSLAHLAASLPDGAGAHALFLAAEQGDCHAIELLREVSDLVAILVANLVTILSPEVVVLGGTIGLHEMMLKRAQAVTASCSMPSCRSVMTVTTARLGGDAGLLGAAHQVFAGQ